MKKYLYILFVIFLASKTSANIKENIILTLKNVENINFDFLGTLTIDTWNNSKTIEFMLDDIIYADVT